MNRRSFIATSSAAVLFARTSLAQSSQRFDLTQEAAKIFGPVELSYRAGWQSFGFDTQHKRILYTQPAPSDGKGGITSAKAAGEVRVGALRLSGKAESDGYMQFSGFGHGGSTGVESAEDGTYLWIEADGQPHGEYCYGRRICRLRWNPKFEGPFDTKDIGTDALRGSRLFTLKPGSTENSVTVDDAAKRLILRFRWPGGNGLAAGMYYSVYTLAEILQKGDAAKPIVDAIREDAVLRREDGKVYRPFQGFALHGDFGYVLTGAKSKQEDNANDAPVNLVSFCITSNTTSIKTTAAPSTMGQELAGREPEGVAVMMDGGKPRLCWAMKSDGRVLNAKGTIRQQLMSVYTQDRLLPAERL